MAGRSFGLGALLSKVLILGLAGLCIYLYFQLQSAQKRVAHLTGQNVQDKGLQIPWSNYKLNLPSDITAPGAHELNLINSARKHLSNAETAAQKGNFGEASSESKSADNDLQQAEQGASSQTRTAVNGLRSTVGSLQKRVHAAEQAFQSANGQ